jgi:hypothetical protein
MLSNAFKTQKKSSMLMNACQFRFFSAVKEYDVAVIGGGPGGKS